LGLVEIGAHFIEIHRRVPEADWVAARLFVTSRSTPEDLVAFAPTWADPLGRMYFGPAVATVAREGRPDEARFPRAYEVSLRGAHLPALADWTREDVSRFGGVTVTTLRNPAPVSILEDLVSLVGAGSPRIRVSRVDGNRESECSYGHGSVQSGGLGYGPAIPGNRFSCPGGGFVGVSVVADLDYVARQCIFAPPSGGGVLRLRFSEVAFGDMLRGHHTLYVEAERGKTGAPVSLAFKTDSTPLGTVFHRDGDGWKPFGFDTGQLKGQRADLIVDISSSGDRRTYCFEAITEGKASAP
jgi:hypothetical protein